MYFNNNIFIFIFIFIFCMCVSITLKADPPSESWAKVYTQDGINVFQDPTQQYPTFKGEGIIEANIFELLAVLSDVKRRPEWVKGLTESKILEGTVESKVIIYERFHIPWPCDDRDAVVESVINQDLKKLEVSVVYHEISYNASPEASSTIRMPHVLGNMFFRYVDDKHVFARFVISLGIGGHFPDWVVNYLVRQAPVDTIHGLLHQVEKTKGEYNDFIKFHKDKAATLK